MTDYDNRNSGALFKNDKQGNENRPDYKGNLNVDGTDYWISAWLKTAKSGQKYMSLSVQPKEEKAPQNGSQDGTREDNGFEDKIPDALTGSNTEEPPF